MTAPARRWPDPWKIGVLSALYFAQGLPFGFQSNALPLYLRELGLSYTQVSLARALALPWALKVIWAPLIDRYSHPTLGRRKSWIVPMQLLLAATCVIAAFFPLNRDTLLPFLACILMMNFFAATQDIAVDGMAVDLLEKNELGAGNAAQVVGYKVGMITGGGLLVALAAKAGWSSLFLSMAGLCLLAMVTVLFVKERDVHVDHTGEKVERLGWRELFRRMRELVSRPGVGWLLLAVATYKMGETLADAMFGLWMQDVHHIAKEQIALWLGTWGIVASLAGSFLGGLLATRVSIKRAVFIAALMRVIPLALQWAMVAGFAEPGPDTVIPLTCAEHFFGGILTTTMFALMMASVDRRIGATHFTLLATVEVIGKSGPGLAAGKLVDLLGFSPVFGASVILSVLFLLVVPMVPQSPLPSRGEG
jgi:MFS transporter, PAT family, beta-lactamase induction signal transducer AmpG